MKHYDSAKAFLAPKLRQVLQFMTRQGIAVAGNMTYGLLCVRVLPVSDYAKFAVLFGFMGSLTVLLDVGISGTLVPMVGDRITNLQLISNYVASIRKIAVRVYAVVAPIAAICFVLLVRKQHWSALVVTQMVSVLLVTAWFARVSASYGSVLILRRDRARYYRIQIIGSLGSLALLILFWAVHYVNVYVGVLLNVAQITYMATSYYRRSRELLGVKGHASADQEIAIARLALPSVPSVVFFAIQGQITLMLITFFGHNAVSIASMGALGGLGRILGFVAQINPVLVEPYFARIPAPNLKRIYLLSVIAIAIFVGGFTSLAFLFPQAFLWILGPKYSSLHSEVGLVILASSLGYIGGFLWCVNSSRRYIYWWHNIANIVSTLLIEIVLIWKLDMSSLKNLLILQVACGGVGVLTNAAAAAYGFWRGPQKLHVSDVGEIPPTLK